MTTTHLTMGIVCLFTFGHGCPWPEEGPWSEEGPWPEEGPWGEDDPSTSNEPCTWNLDDGTFPLQVWAGQAVFGEIAFDGNCDLLVGGGEELPYAEALYRVSKDDGSVSVVVPAAALPAGYLVVSGITHRASDNRIYFTVTLEDAPDVVLAVDDQGQLHPVVELPNSIAGLTVAPDGFGSFGDHLIAVSGPRVLAIDVDAEDPQQAITEFATAQGMILVAEFAADGTLYVAEYGGKRISTVTADGVFEEFYSTDPGGPVGMVLSPDGTRMFVTHMQSWSGSIDEISIPDKTLTHHTTFEVVGMPVGMVFDGANRVLYERSLQNYAVIDMIDVQ